MENSALKTLVKISTYKPKPIPPENLPYKTQASREAREPYYQVARKSGETYDSSLRPKAFRMGVIDGKIQGQN